MNAIHSILVIVDPTAQTHPSVQKAAHLAARLNARLELYVCDTQSSRATRFAQHSRHPDAATMISLHAFLETIAAPLRDQGLDVACEVAFGDPLVEKLIDKLSRTTADLVVKDTHHHSIARRTFLGNTDWDLIRACPVPLLLTKPAPWSQVPRIVAAVDPGHANDKPAALDQRILDYANCLTQRLGGELHAVHAYVPVAVIAAAVSSEPSGALAMSAEDMRREEEAKRKEVTDLVAAFNIDRSRVHVQPGGPAQLLPHLTRELRADMVAMGALSRRGIRRAFIGSTAEDVLEHLPCDALIVKPADFSAAMAGLCSL